MSVRIPNPMGINLNGAVAVSGNMGVNGNMDVGLKGLDNIHVSVDHLPKIQVGLDKLNIGLDKVNVGLDPLEVRVGLTEIPEIRAHMPAHFSVGLSIAGFELICVKLCGEAQMITEPYRRNPAEKCGHARPVDIKQPDVGPRDFESAADRAHDIVDHGAG